MEIWNTPVAYWPTSPVKSSKPKRKDISTEYVLPLLFFLYMIGLYALFALYKLILILTYKIYVSLKRMEKIRLKKRLVIVGGGYAGTCAAMGLEHDFLVTLIDSKEYFEFTPSKLRLLVDPQHADRVQIKYTSFLKNTLLVCDLVKKITPEYVITEHQTISYDYLLICTGSRTSSPQFEPLGQDSNVMEDFERNRQANIVSVRTQHFEQYSKLLKHSQSVLIIGGGTVGVELAGEIVENHKDKQITIVHPAQYLMQRCPPKAIRYTEDFLRKNGVYVITNDKVIAHEGNRFKTAKGIMIDADTAFLCTGNTPNSEFLNNSVFSQSLNTYGFVKVNEYLQIDGYPNVFVAGDLTDIPAEEEKLCQTAAAEVKTVITNLKLLETNKPLFKYIPGTCPMVISLGKYDGIFTYRGWTLSGFVPAAMKEFIEWKEMVHYWNWQQFKIGAKAKEKWSSQAHIV